MKTREHPVMANRNEELSFMLQRRRTMHHRMLAGSPGHN